MSCNLGIYLENQTVLLGKQARFFCQMQSKYEDLRFRINGGVTTLSLQTPGITLTIENRTLGINDCIQYQYHHQCNKKEKQHRTGVLRYHFGQREHTLSNSDNTRLGYVIYITVELTITILQVVQLSLRWSMR